MLADRMQEHASTKETCTMLERWEAIPTDSEVTYWNLTVPFICSSWIWWYFTSICLDFCRMTPKVINLMAPWLLHPIGAGPSEVFTAISPTTSFIMRLSQRLSQVACKQVMYSASSIESVRTFCDLTCQWIKPDMTSLLLALMFLSPNTHLLTDFWVLRFPAQSESVYLMMVIGFGSRRWWIRNLAVVFRYRSTVFAAVAYISRGWTLYRLRVVTLKAISGWLPSAVYMSDPTINRYSLWLASLSSQQVLARTVWGSSGDLAGFASNNLNRHMMVLM